MTALERNDILLLTKVFVYLFIVLKIVFYNEPFFSVVRYTFALSIMSFIPGYFLTKKILEQDTQRLLFGSMVSFTILGVVSYYAGLMGVPLHITSFVLPALLIITGIIITKEKQ